MTEVIPEISTVVGWDKRRRCPPITPYLASYDADVTSNVRDYPPKRGYVSHPITAAESLTEER